MDARHPDIFNGWALDGLSRGGHIEGATDFAYTFLTCSYDEKGNLEKKTRDEVLSETLARRGLAPGKKVIVYDTRGKDASLVADFLRLRIIYLLRCLKILYHNDYTPTITLILIKFFR